MFNVYSTEYDTIDTTWPSSFFQRKLEVIWLQSSMLETFKKLIKQKFSRQYHYNIKQISDKNKKKYQMAD